MEFVYGPLLYISIAVFVLGMIARIALYINGLNGRLERVAYSYHMGQGLQGAAVSIVKWLIPGLTHGWRVQPLMTLVFFLFHIGAVLIPLFLLGHTVVIESLFGISLPALSVQVGDILTIMALIGLAGLALRRIVVPCARVLTTGQDWLILLLTAMPFVSGAMARFSATPDSWMLIHVLTGELFLIFAPFTKLSHIALFFMSRAQIGMDFAIKRGGFNRGASFPW